VDSPAKIAIESGFAREFLSEAENLLEALEARNE
jgi:hypothetical protein